ncbi:MAG: hypothetical protein H6703_08460 [Myxococcales bacterium]|nr:hypothetical protein [Myxococcales bacterium]
MIPLSVEANLVDDFTVSFLPVAELLLTGDGRRAGGGDVALIIADPTGSCRMRAARGARRGALPGARLLEGRARSLAGA